MMKKVSAWFLALFLVGGMAACNAPQGNSGEQDQTTEESPAKNHEEEAGHDHADGEEADHGHSDEDEAEHQHSGDEGSEHPTEDGGSEHPTGDGGSEHPN
ncbi:MAG: hypothetical protein RI842_03475 [Schleiferiaceae bacterium]|nr:hypothetical protein [Schleiferiaceae bacterium]MDR9441754.1 hypothetical protein [Schleiferiaceae bacterium]